MMVLDGTQISNPRLLGCIKYGKIILSAKINSIFKYYYIRKCSIYWLKNPNKSKTRL